MNKEMCMYDVKKCHCVWICFIITHIKYDFKNIIRSLLFDERRHHHTGMIFTCMRWCVHVRKYNININSLL